jgi:hypothetical protein
MSTASGWMLSHWRTLLRQRSWWHYFQGGGFGIDCVLLLIKHQPTTAYYHPPGQRDDGEAPTPPLVGPRVMSCPGVLLGLRSTFPCQGILQLRTERRQRTCRRSCRPLSAPESAAAAMCRPSSPSMTDPTPFCSAAYATSKSSWATGRRTSPPPLRRCRRHAATPRSSRLPLPHRPSASASPSHPHHCHRQLNLELLFLARLPGFLKAQRKHLQAATRKATVGNPLGNGTTSSLQPTNFLTVSRIKSWEVAM